MINLVLIWKLCSIYLHFWDIPAPLSYWNLAHSISLFFNPWEFCSDSEVINQNIHSHRVGVDVEVQDTEINLHQGQVSQAGALRLLSSSPSTQAQVPDKYWLKWHVDETLGMCAFFWEYRNKNSGNWVEANEGFNTLILNAR